MFIKRILKLLLFFIRICYLGIEGINKFKLFICCFEVFLCLLKFLENFSLILSSLMIKYFFMMFYYSSLAESGFMIMNNTQKTIRN